MEHQVGRMFLRQATAMGVGEGHGRIVPVDIVAQKMDLLFIRDLITLQYLLWQSLLIIDILVGYCL